MFWYFNYSNTFRYELFIKRRMPTTVRLQELLVSCISQAYSLLLKHQQRVSIKI